MKVFSKLIILLALLTLALSWKGLFERYEKLKEKKEDIQDLKDNLHLTSLGLASLKDISFKNLTHFHAPDMSATLEKLKHIIPRDLDPSHHKEVDAFFTGAFEEFKLPKPTELIECFGSVSGPVFFRKLRLINDLLQHSKSHDNLKLHTDFAQFEVLMHALDHANDCMLHSHDFERLTDSLDISLDPEIMKRAEYLYYQAKFHTLADDYKGIVEQVDKENYNEAGKLFAILFKNSIKDFKKTGEDLLAYQAFGNGLSGALGVSLPSESIACYNSEQAKLLMDFFRGVANAVEEGRWYRAEKSAAEYWEKEGKALLDEIPNKVWLCDMRSKDSKEISEKIGMELGSDKFMEKMFDYMNDHNIMFYSYLRSMSAAINRGDYLHAGASYAHLLEAVAKSA